MRIKGKGLVDRSDTVTFRFDGRSYDGFAGDTVASALLANEVKLMGRSFKYHRPRGVLTAGSEEPNALVTVGRGGVSGTKCASNNSGNLRGAGGAQPECVAVTGSGCVGSEQSVCSFAGSGFLLQDLHVAEGFLGTGL